MRETKKFKINTLELNLFFSIFNIAPWSWAWVLPNLCVSNKFFQGGINLHWWRVLAHQIVAGRRASMIFLYTPVTLQTEIRIPRGEGYFGRNVYIVLASAVTRIYSLLPLGCWEPDKEGVHGVGVIMIETFPRLFLGDPPMKPFMRLKRFCLVLGNVWTESHK